MKANLPVALTIAGSDSGGGAGIQADLLTFAARNVFGTSAITCLTAQNPAGVRAVQAMPAAMVTAQMEQVGDFFPLAAIKTGMLFNAEIIRAVAVFLRKNPAIPTVIDPVMVATSGAVLLEDSAIDALCNELLPLATLITPNLDEAAVLCGKRPDSVAAMHTTAAQLCSRFGTAILLKGGHLEDQTLTDVLHLPNGLMHEYKQSRIEAVNTHGSGCTLASAIAAELAHNRSLTAAVSSALAYLQAAMRKPLLLNGESFIRH